MYQQEKSAFFFRRQPKASTKLLSMGFPAAVAVGVDLDAEKKKIQLLRTMNLVDLLSHHQGNFCNVRCKEPEEYYEHAANVLDSSSVPQLYLCSFMVLNYNANIHISA